MGRLEPKQIPMWGRTERKADRPSVPDLDLMIERAPLIAVGRGGAWFVCNLT